MTCKECGKIFQSERSLHTHLKAHNMFVADYYCKHYPRWDKFSGEQIQFKHKNEYFSTHFVNRNNLLAWLKNSPKEVKSPIILDMLEQRIASKNLEFAPNEVELFFSGLPPIDEYKKCFGSYSVAAKSCGVEPIFSGKWAKEWSSDYSHKKIFIDSREQKPLNFQNQEILKLDIGDYAVGGDDFAHTFVDRKSFQDWASTLLGDSFNRFEREIQRCAQQKSFLWVVIESDLQNLELENSRSKHTYKLSFVGHQMRVLQHKYRGTIQFYFSGGRRQSEEVIPKLLCLGEKLWLSDAQYWIPKQKGELDF